MQSLTLARSVRARDAEIDRGGERALIVGLGQESVQL